MTKVYLLYDYQEYGAENVRATLDREKLPQIIADYFKEQPHEVAAALDRLAAGLAALDAGSISGYGEFAFPEVGPRYPYRLTKGWGGLVLQVAELE